MALYWAYGLNADGEGDLIGPSDMREAIEGDAEIAGLRSIRIIYAPDRAQALQQVQGIPRAQRSPLTSDEPVPTAPVFQQREDDNVF